jgi:dihydroorotate dehydrogenase electron transfer subunit
MTRTATSAASPAEEARLLDAREVLPGRLLQSWRAPRIARAVGPGQFVRVLAPRHPGLLLPATPVAGYDRVQGTITLLHAGTSGSAGRLASTRVGDRARLEGPLGRGFALDARSRFLLVLADVEGLARVRAVVDEAVASGRQVTLLLGAPSVSQVYPSSLLPDEAEYVVVTADGSLGHRGEVVDVLPRYEAWADQCFAAGSEHLLDRVVALARGRDARMGVARLGRRRGRRPEPGGRDARRRAWLQVALAHEAGCALGVCAGCVAWGSQGPVRVCREGPAFAADELRWEPAS